MRAREGRDVGEMGVVGGREKVWSGGLVRVLEG